MRDHRYLWRTVDEAYPRLKASDRRILKALLIDYVFAEDRRSIAEVEEDIVNYLSSRIGLEAILGEAILIPPSPEDCSGDYYLGTVVGGRRKYGFMLRDEELSSNILVAGRIGTGKTTTVKRLLLEWAKRGKPAIVFDWKGDYVDLKHLNPCGEYSYIWIFNPAEGTFKFNPLRIPETRNPIRPITWIETFVDMFIHSFGLRESSASILLTCLLELYRENGIEPYRKTHVKNYPTLLDLRNKVGYYRPLSSFDRESKRSILVRLRLLTEGAMGRTYNTRRGIPLETLLKHFTVFNLKDIPLVSAKKFFIECLYGLIYEYAKAVDDRTKTKCLLVIEEAHNILSRQKAEHEKGIPTKPEICLAELRDFGYGTIIIDQKPSELSPDAIANTSIKICHCLDREEDREAIANAILIPQEHRDILSRLDPGYAVVKVYRKNLKEPFIVKIEPPPKEVKPLNTAEWKPNLTSLEHSILKLIETSTACIPSQIKAKLNIDGTTTSKTLRKLVKMKLIGYWKPKSRGNPVIYFPRKRSLNPSEKAGKHSKAVDLVKKILMENGYSIVEEGGGADIYIRREGETIPVEIETGANSEKQIAKNIIKNILKHGTVYFIALNQKTYNRILQTAAKLKFINRNTNISLKISLLEGGKLVKTCRYEF